MELTPIRLLWTVAIKVPDVECEGPENDGTGHLIPCHEDATTVIVYLPHPAHPLIRVCDEHLSRINKLCAIVRDDSLVASHLAEVFLWRRGYGKTPRKRKRAGKAN